MEDQEVIALLNRYQLGTCSELEKAKLESWYLSQHSDATDMLSPAEFATDLLLIREGLDLVAARPVYKLWKRMAGIAAAVTAITLGVWLFHISKKQMTAHRSEIAVHHDIKPGGHRATIMLANGKVIDLNGAKTGVSVNGQGISYTDGEQLQQYDETQTLTAATPKGGIYDFVLPDGSKVFLNAATIIRFPSAFGKGDRAVELVTGEAYFEVKKDSKRPFLVKNAGQVIEVLGTHFNVNAYSNEPAIATTLVEGSVKVIKGSVSQVIRPGEQSINNGKAIEVQKVSVEEVMDWKGGDFYLNHVDFKTAMRKIARWYDVEFIYDAEVPKDLESGGWVSRNNNLSAVLAAIEATGLAKFELKGRKINVYKSIAQ